MKINTKELESNLCDNLIRNHFLDSEPVLVESWEVSAYQMRRVLMDRHNSPYFHPLYKGVVRTNAFSFYAMCFYAFMSGVEYAVIKNGNIFPNWDYWTMHRYIGDELSFQASIFWKGLKNSNSLLLGMAGCDQMGRKGVMAYRIIAMVIEGFFSHEGIEDFEVLDEDGYETEELISEELVSNVPEVLASFHRIGIVCAFQALSLGKTDEGKANDYILWGGPGMLKIGFLR